MVTLLHRVIGTVLLAARHQGRRPGLLEARKSQNSPGRRLHSSSAREVGTEAHRFSGSGLRSIRSTGGGPRDAQAQIPLPGKARERAVLVTQCVRSAGEAYRHTVVVSPGIS